MSTTDKAKDAASTAASQGQEVAQNAAANAQGVAATAQAGASEVAGQAREQAAQLTGQATDHLKSIAGETHTQLREHASTQADRAAQGVRTFSDQAKALAEGRIDEAGVAGQYAQQAADKLQEVAQRLEDGGLDGAIEDVSNFARRRPGTFLLGAGLIGFGLGRILRGAQAAKQENESLPSATTGPSFATQRPVASDLDLTSPEALATEGAYSPRVGGY